MTSVEEVDEGWRTYGKMFRANIVSADESNGGNIFTLSDSCAIERYYRVADRYEFILSAYFVINFGRKIEYNRSHFKVCFWSAPIGSSSSFSRAI